MPFRCFIDSAFHFRGQIFQNPPKTRYLHHSHIHSASTPLSLSVDNVVDVLQMWMKPLSSRWKRSPVQLSQTSQSFKLHGRVPAHTGAPHDNAETHMVNKFALFYGRPM